jgi:SAM-dependent methyltransferase
VSERPPTSAGGVAPGDANAAARTDASYWDSYWERVTVPREHVRRPGAHYINAILDVFDRHLPRDPSLRAVEVGGAPGQYLAYLHRSRGYHVTCIDFSAAGCRKTVENFRLLGIPGDVIQADVTADLDSIPTFDVVYSLGLIEHFADRVPIVGQHVRLVRPDGYLVLGVPNFRGLTGWFMRTLQPGVYETHEIAAMDLSRWDAFETAFDLTVVWKGYLGGFEPNIFARRRESRRLGTVVPYATARALNAGLSERFGFLRRFNGPRLSGYAMAVYRVP